MRSPTMKAAVAGVFGAIGFLGLAVASPAPVAAETPTLQELVDRLHSQSHALVAADERAEAARQEANRVGAFPNPIVSYGYFVDPIETRLGAQRHKVGLVQTIPIAKLGLQASRADMLADALTHDRDRSYWELRRDLVTTWGQYYVVGQAIEIIGENLRLLRAVEDVALTSYAEGYGQQSHVLQLQIEVARLEDRVAHWQDQREPVAAQINALLGQSLATPIAMPSTLTYPELDLTVIALQKLVDTRNPRLQSARSRETAAEQTVRLARRAAIPNLTVGAEYIFVDPYEFSSTADNGRDAVVAMASLNIPLFFGGLRAQKRQAEAMARSATRATIDMRAHLDAQLTAAIARWRDALRQHNLYRRVLAPRALQSYEVAREGYRGGIATFQDVIDAQQSYLTVSLEVASSRATVLASLATLETLVATNLLFPDSEVKP